MDELPAYCELLSPVDSILHSHPLSISHFAVKLKALHLFGLRLRFSPYSLNTGGKVSYSRGPVALKLQKDSDFVGKYCFQFQARPQLRIASTCRTDRLQPQTAHSVTMLDVCLAQCKGRTSLQDRPFQLETEWIIGVPQRWFGFSAAYNISQARITRLDLAGRIGEVTLRRYCKEPNALSTGLIELAYLRKLEGATVAALFQTNCSDFHFLEFGMETRVADTVKVRWRVDSTGTVETSAEAEDSAGLRYRLGLSINTHSAKLAAIADCRVSLAVMINFDVLRESH